MMMGSWHLSASCWGWPLHLHCCWTDGWKLGEWYVGWMRVDCLFLSFLLSFFLALPPSLPPFHSSIYKGEHGMYGPKPDGAIQKQNKTKHNRTKLLNNEHPPTAGFLAAWAREKKVHMDGCGWMYRLCGINAYMGDVAPMRLIPAKIEELMAKR